MPTTTVIDMKPAIEDVVRGLLKPLEDRLLQLEHTVKEQQAEVEKLRTQQGLR